MKRRVFNLLAGLSLLLLVVSLLLLATLWMNRTLYLGRYEDGQTWQSPDFNLATHTKYYVAWYEDGFLQFYGVPEFSDSAPSPCWRIRWWLLPLLTSLLPLLGLILNIRKRRDLKYRKINGLCLACGYDLRASKERCPECGTLIPSDLERKPVS